MNQHVDRRNFGATAPAARNAIAVGSALAGVTEAFLADLMEWREAVEAASHEDDHEDDIAPLWDARCAIMDRISARPAVTAGDVVVKVLVATCYGTFCLDHDELDNVVKDAMRLVPIPAPAALGISDPFSDAGEPDPYEDEQDCSDASSVDEEDAATDGDGTADDVAADREFLADMLEWGRAVDAWGAAWDEDENGADVPRLTEARQGIADRIVRRPTDTAFGLAAKILVVTEYGDFVLSGEGLGAVVADAQRICPTPVPSYIAEYAADRLRQGCTAGLPRRVPLSPGERAGG